jgi:hypothetical protein
MAKIYLPVSDPTVLAFIKQKKGFHPSAVRALAKLLYTLLSAAVVDTFFLYLMPSLSNKQVKALVDSRLKRLAVASDEELEEIYERIRSKYEDTNFTLPTD